MKPLNLFQVTFACNGGLPAELAELQPESTAEGYQLQLHDQARYAEAIARLARHDCRIVSTESKSKSLEDYFIELVRSAPEPAA
jgi:hypothetical protein